MSSYLSQYNDFIFFLILCILPDKVNCIKDHPVITYTPPIFDGVNPATSKPKT